MCTCVSHIHASPAAFPPLTGLKCIHYWAGLSVEINVNKSILCGSQEGPSVGDSPLMFTPAVAFHLLIRGSPFSGNDSDAEALAWMLKACLNRCAGWRKKTGKYVVLLLLNQMNMCIIFAMWRFLFLFFSDVDDLKYSVTSIPVTYSGLHDAYQQRHR